MFTKILIANRGEIACRIIRTAKKMGIQTVAVYSEADRNALHVKMADEAVYVGAAPSRESYLCGDKVIAAALQTGAQAIHPGYGFLSENANFCRACQANDLVFIGPPIAAIEAMGSKSAAKQIMEHAGVPLVPGYHGEDQSPALLKQHSDAMGYPVLLKAAAGGGGKGMRQVWQADEFDQALAAAKRESLASFGDDTMLVEKYLTQPRHVEIQVFSDNHGNGVYLFERDCSVQRRHQKIIEEAPAPHLPETVRQQMGEAALKAAAAIDYRGAGTVEFLYDIDGSFYFMEMNTRLQVEHPVTEMITRQDLVEWQLRVANNEQLPLAQADLSIHGHAFEARIYAEDPNNDFLPASGVLDCLVTPTESEWVRVDTGVLQGDEVSVFYDPMIAKLICWGENRERALLQLRHALQQYRISGVDTNIGFLSALAAHPAFINAELDTGFIEKHRQTLFNDNAINEQEYLPIAAAALLLQRVSKTQETQWHSQQMWRLNAAATETLKIDLNDSSYSVDVTHMAPNHYRCVVGDTLFEVEAEILDDKLAVTLNGLKQQFSLHHNHDHAVLFVGNKPIKFKLTSADLGLESDSDSTGGLTAPMNGTVVALLVSPHTTVKKGTPLLVMEAMKMEHSICAPADGEVSEFYFQQGELVSGGTTLLDFNKAEVTA